VPKCPRCKSIVLPQYWEKHKEVCPAGIHKERRKEEVVEELPEEEYWRLVEVGEILLPPPIGPVKVRFWE